VKPENSRIFGRRIPEQADCLVNLADIQVARPQISPSNSGTFARVKPQGLLDVGNCRLWLPGKLKQLSQMKDRKRVVPVERYCHFHLRPVLRPIDAEPGRGTLPATHASASGWGQLQALQGAAVPRAHPALSSCSLSSCSPSREAVISSITRPASELASRLCASTHPTSSASARSYRPIDSVYLSRESGL
jgi:hypothetical protein